MATLPHFSKSIQSVTAIALTCSLAIAAYAQSAPETAAKGEGEPTLAVETSTETISSTTSLSSQFHPSTPWPVVAQTPSETVPFPQNLLAYSAVEVSSQSLLKDDFATWSSYLGTSPRVETLSAGLYKTTGCLESSCDTKRSLLIVDPYARKVFVAMVSENKVVMRPSLMSWPDAAIPSLKQWLADATSED